MVVVIVPLVLLGEDLFTALVENLDEEPDAGAVGNPLTLTATVKQATSGPSRRLS